CASHPETPRLNFLTLPGGKTRFWTFRGCTGFPGVVRSGRLAIRDFLLRFSPSSLRFATFLRCTVSLIHFSVFFCATQNVSAAFRDSKTFHRSSYSLFWIFWRDPAFFEAFRIRGGAFWQRITVFGDSRAARRGRRSDSRVRRPHP